MADEGSKEAVAFRLWQELRETYGDEIKRGCERELALYRDCLRATAGKAAAIPPAPA